MKNRRGSRLQLPIGTQVYWFARGQTNRAPSIAYVCGPDPVKGTRQDGLADLIVMVPHRRYFDTVTGVRFRQDPDAKNHPKTVQANGLWGFSDGNAPLVVPDEVNPKKADAA